MISTRRGISKLMGLALGCSVMMATPSYAVPYDWTDWTTADATSAAGTLGGVNVNFSGNLAPAAQLAGGINYWATDPAIYTGGGVDNGPATSDIIRLNGGGLTGSQTLTFTDALLNPVSITNPVMAILSLGRLAVPVEYVFDKPFTILNDGPGGHFDPSDLGSLTKISGNILSGDTLVGLEGHGLIRFNGTFSSISWNVPLVENWHGFTVGSAVPEPASLMLLGAGLAAIGIWRRKAGKIG